MNSQFQLVDLISYLNNEQSIMNYRQNELVETEQITFLPNGEILIISQKFPQKTLNLRQQPIFRKLGIISLKEDLILQSELMRHQQEVIHFCYNEKIIGSEFYVKEQTKGRIFNGSDIQSLSFDDRKLVFKEIVSLLCRIHSVGLGQRIFNYQSIIQSLKFQYKTNETRIQTNVEDLLYWLFINIPEWTIQESLCLGNVELNNFIFDFRNIKIINLQSWNSVSIGNSHIELARFLSNYEVPMVKHVTEYGLKKVYYLLGLPKKIELIQDYCLERQLDTIKYLSYNTIIVLLQRAIFKQYCIKIQVNPEKSNVFQSELEILSKSAWDIVLELTNHDPFQIKLRAETDKLLWAKYPVTQRCQSYYYRIKDFIRDEVLPIEKSQFEIIYSFNKVNHQKELSIIKSLQKRAKSMGLWNLFIQDPLYGKGLNNLEYTFLSELMGTSFFGHEIFNCYGPDIENIKLLIMLATDYQKSKYLKPLLEGKCKTFFAISERNMPSSNPINFETTITKQGDGYVIKGTKWMISSNQDQSCKFGIVMGKTNLNLNSPFKEQTMFIVDSPNPNIKIKYPLAVLGYDELSLSIVEVEFNNVYVSKENMLGKEGNALAMSQERLLSGKLHHSVRLLGLARRSIDVLEESVKKRNNEGKIQRVDSTFQEKVNNMKCKYQICKTMILNAAIILDSQGVKHIQSLKAVSEVKAFVPQKCQDIFDDCIKLLNTLGITIDYNLQFALQACRSFRLMNDQCELHRKQLTRFSQESYMQHDLINGDGYISLL